jgi:hypothetical protein
LGILTCVVDEDVGIGVHTSDGADHVTMIDIRLMPRGFKYGS